MGLGVNLLVALPVQLGLISTVTSEDVAHFQVPGSNELEITEAGTYTLFRTTQFFETINNEFEVVEVATGNTIELISRNQAIEYDTDAIEGYPILDFKVESPGLYRIVWLSTSEAGTHTALIAPNYHSSNQAVLGLFYGIPLAVVSGTAWLRFNKSESVRKEVAQDKAAKWDAWQSS